MKYCIGNPKIEPVLYIGQKEPIFIGTYEEVKEWIKNYFKTIYG